MMNLIQSAKNNGLDSYVCLKDVLKRLPSQNASPIDQLLANNWQPINR
nr:transposase domain-containing protein [Thiosulfatimonas sediminis]